MMQYRKFVHYHAAPYRACSFPRSIIVACCILCAGALCASPVRAAQTAKPSPAIPQKSATAQVPTSLANQPPTAATVTFTNGQLTVKAHNSELRQILQTITAQTGMKIQGTPGNHRIFGTYGPGQPRQVLSQLLSGFNFNYLLVGTSQNGFPQKLILAGTAPTGPAPAQPVHSVQPAPQNPLPRPQPGPRPSYPPPSNQPSPSAKPPSGSPHQTKGPHQVRTPQQILKELEAMHAKQKKNSSH